MKKFALSFLIVCALFLTTACGKDKVVEDKKDSNDDNTTGEVLTMNCTKNSNEDGNNVQSKAVIKYNSKDKKVISVEDIELTEYPSSFLVDATVNLLNSTNVLQMFNSVEGVNYEISKEDDKTLKISITIEYDKLTESAIKNAFGDFATVDTSLLKVDETIDDLKNSHYSDYVCE